MLNLSNYTLGETNNTFEIEYFEDFYQTLLTMTQQSQRNILVFSHNLDHRLYATEAMYTAFKNLAIASRYSSIRILLQDKKSATGKGHRLLELSQHLSSHVSIRITAREHKDIPETFIIVDERGYIIQESPARYNARSNFNAPLHARGLKEKFTDMWEHGTTDASLRRLGL